jgi:protein phosphatase
MIFVHGGIPHGDLEALAGTPARPYMKNDRFLEQGLRFKKWVVVGHWPVSNYGRRFAQFNPVFSEEQRIIALDGGLGIKSDGQLNALIVKDGVFEVEILDELPAIRALDPQAESEDFFFIRWEDGAVEILKKGEEFSLVRHRSSGRVMEIPNSRLDFGEEPLCLDHSDYVLPVSPGDALKLVQNTSKGAICKKNGVVGWYAGRFESIE